MALSDVQQAYQQYVSALPWEQSTASALLALEALEYLWLHRAQAIGAGETQLTYERLETELAAIRKFLGYDRRNSGGSAWRRVR